MKATLRKTDNKKSAFERKLEKILSRFEGRRDELIPVLQAVQNGFGYLPGETFGPISKKTGVPSARLYGVVTFYSQFYLSKRGKNIVRMCRGTACHVRGADAVREAVEKMLCIADGGTTPDYKFTLETVACLGACALAPVVVVNNAYHGKMTPQKVKALLEKHKKGKK